MAKHITTLQTIERDALAVAPKLLAGLGTSVTVTSVTEALKYAHITGYPSWVPTAVAIVAFFIGGYIKKDTITASDAGVIGTLETTASTLGDDLSDGDYQKLAEDAFAAAGVVLDGDGNATDTATPATA